eukprot:5665563-Amphidinium_carterae.1
MNIPNTNLEVGGNTTDSYGLGLILLSTSCSMPAQSSSPRGSCASLAQIVTGVSSIAPWARPSPRPWRPSHVRARAIQL